MRNGVRNDVERSGNQRQEFASLRFLLFRLALNFITRSAESARCRFPFARFYKQLVMLTANELRRPSAISCRKQE